MKRPFIAVACSLSLLLVPAMLAQTSRPGSRPRRDRTPYAGRDLAGSVQPGQVESKLLGRSVGYMAYLPPGYKEEANAAKKYPIIFFLHGLFEDSNRWMGNRGGAALFDNAIKEGKIPPMIVLVPDAAYSFYMDRIDGKEPYARFFIEELVPWTDKTFRTTGRREERVLGGNSMGGFGALRFAFLHPELFSAVIVHSPAILPESPSEASPRAKRVMSMMRDGEVNMIEQLFGDPIDMERWKASNPLSLAATVDLKPPVAIYVDCGESDSYGFDETCRAFDEVLKKRNIPHEFAIRPGGHGWGFVQSAFPHSAAFLDKHLKKASTSGSESTSPKKSGDGAASRPGGN